MSNESLIGALEQMRDTYTQRQRAASGLMAALKGVTSALGKAGRSLRDYSEQNGTPAAGALGQAQQAFGALRLKEEAVDPLLPELRREEKLTATLVTALKDALAALRAESIDVIKLGRAYSALQGIKLQDATLTALLPELDQDLQQAQRSLSDTFGVALRHALAEQGIALGGRPPSFEIGPFELEANFVSRTAALSYGKNLINRRVPLSVEMVIKAYQGAIKAIMGRNEDAARWIEQLYTAWETVRKKRGTTEPRANIVDCYLEMVLLRQPRAFRSAPTKGGFAEYSRAQFAYDFFTFTNQEGLTYKGLRAFGTGATKSQADNPERSFWIVEGNTPHEGRYIADVKFDRDE
jgi:hypothetical protein